MRETGDTRQDVVVKGEIFEREIRHRWRVTGVFDPEIEALGYDKIRSTVEVDLVDGRTLVARSDERYRGGPEKPFTKEELYGKFRDCAQLVMSATKLLLRS